MDNYLFFDKSNDLRNNKSIAITFYLIIRIRNVYFKVIPTYRKILKSIEKIKNNVAKIFQ